MSDPRLTPEELERIAELRRRIMERHPDAEEANAYIRSMLTPAAPTHTATERKDASRQALAILTASRGDDYPTVRQLVDEQGEGLALVLIVFAGYSAGLLRSFDDECEGAADLWLANLGASVEAMPEGDS